MSKEKFSIPFPDDETMQNEIGKIVATGVKRKEFFLSYLTSMYRQIGFRQLFSDRSELAFTLITAITLLICYLFSPDPSFAKADDVYAFIFLVSPVLFVALSFFTYSNKMANGTFEVEMVCKYHVFQIIAFRMLMFSLMTMMLNLFVIVWMISVYDHIQFFRALMISNSGLFLFSTMFLYVLMKRRTNFVSIITIASWLMGNILLSVVSNQWYSELLINMPLFIYGVVIAASLFGYIQLLKRFLHFKKTEEVY